MLAERWPLVTAAEMRALERHTIDGLGVPGALLMELAGAAVAREVLSLRAGRAAVLVFCGAGNNGGDGLVVARHLHLRGVAVRVVPVPPAPSWRGDAAANAERARAAGVPFAAALETPAPGSVIVDAIF